ncbi:MAG: type III pantothenate kinase [Rikenellaceae bacterium]
MNLIIDIGNSLCKVAVMESGQIIEMIRVPALTLSLLENFLRGYPAIRGAVLSTVRNDDSEMENFLKKKFEQFLKVTHQTPLPIRNGYSTPQTLGIDRLMSAVGAVAQFPGKELLIFDLGSAITIDHVSAEGEFLGGNISPGMNLRFKALHAFTEKLPMCYADENFSLIGKTTEEAIKNGVILGIINEIHGYIDLYLAKNEEIVVIFTGGDAKYFVFKVKNTIFVDCLLLLKGLNKVLEYNYDQN